MADTLRASANPAALILPSGGFIETGDLVRLHPRIEYTTFDRALEGRIARVSAIEEDFNGGVHIGVMAQNDPELDGGPRHEPPHHFFFEPDEVEPLDFERELLLP